MIRPAARPCGGFDQGGIVLLVRRLGAVVCILASAAFIGACGEDSGGGGGESPPPAPESETADAAALEEEITRDLSEQVGVEPRAVDCPDDIPLAEDEEFECTVTAPNGDEVTFAGTLTDDQGSFEGEVLPEGQSGQSGAPTVADLESMLQTTIEDVRDAPETPLETVDCPDDVDLGGQETFECELSGGEETGTVEVTVRNEQFEYSGSFGGSGFGGSPQPIEGE